MRSNAPFSSKRGKSMQIRFLRAKPLEKSQVVAAFDVCFCSLLAYRCQALCAVGSRQNSATLRQRSNMLSVVK